MMGYQENLDFYLNMSRKKLQKLCKKHDLRASRSHAQLAKSLSSFFKKRNLSSAASVEKLINPMDGSLKKSFVPELKATQTVNLLEESTGGVHGRPNSSKVDIHGQTSGTNKIPDDEMLLCQTGNQVVGHIVNLEKPQTAINVLCPSCPANKGTEDFSSSTSGHHNVGVRSCVAADIQELTTNQLLGLECKGAGIRIETGNFSETRNVDQKLIQDAVTNSTTCNMVLVPCGHNRPREHSMESGIVSVDEICTGTPSLQFFVVSGGGINLYVDLNSSPSEWINSMKDEVCINQNAEHHESRALLKHIGDSPEADDHLESSPSVDTGMGLQGIGVEQTTDCTISSSSSVVSESCNSEAYPPDKTVVTSGSYILTSGSVPTRCLEENQVVSSSHATYSVQNHLASDIASCPQEGIVLSQDSVDASFVMVKSGASLPDASIKSIANNDDGAIDPVAIDGSTPKTACADFGDVEDNALSNTTNHTPAKNKLSVTKEIQDSVDTSQYGHLKDHSGACEGSFRQCMNDHPDNGSTQGGLSNSCQHVGRVVLDGPMADAQSEVGVADGLFYRQTCSRYGTLIPEEPMSMIQDE